MRAACDFPAGSKGMNADEDTDQVKNWKDEDFSYIIHYNAYQEHPGCYNEVSELQPVCAFNTSGNKWWPFHEGESLTFRRCIHNEKRRSPLYWFHLEFLIWKNHGIVGKITVTE